MPVGAFDVRSVWIIMMTAVTGCAANGAAVPITPEQHAANIAAAQQAGYRVETKRDHSVFCPTAAPTGSHMGPTCISERDFQALLGKRYSTVPAATLEHTSPGPGPNAGH
jgi:hypothetical protein